MEFEDIIEELTFLQDVYRRAEVQKTRSLNKRVNHTNLDRYWRKKCQAGPKGIAGVNRRRAAKLNRTPEWADSDAILRVYAYAKEVNKYLDGVSKVHVDHIIPLQGEKVSGLHVPENLQVISASDNCRKSNRYELS